MTTTSPQPQTAPRRPGGTGPKARRYRTVFVEPTSLRAAMAHRAAQRDAAAPAPPFRMVTTVDAELEPVRKNVRDAARAVLTWLSAVIAHQDHSDLDAILDACLRPGPDARRVNFNALTDQINATLGTDLSAKRVRTAVRHLRKARQQKARKQSEARAAKPRPVDAAAALRQRVMRRVLDADGSADRVLALDVLAAVRSAAGRLIDSDFGEGIPDSVDAAALADGIAALRHDAQAQADETPAALDRLMRTLRDCDGEPESDMRLVIDGTRAVCGLVGKASLPGVMARLNVLVAGRALLPSGEYVDRLIVLAGQAEALHDDAATRSLLAAARKGPEDQRIPTPLRVTSYCLNNAATHVLERLFTGELDGPHWMRLAQRCGARMQQRDSGFPLLRVTRLIEALTRARLEHDDAIAEDHLAALGEAAALKVLEDLAKFDNNDELIRAAEHHASRVYPALPQRLIRAA